MSTRTAFTEDEVKSFAEKHSLLRLAHLPLGAPLITWLATDYPLEYPLVWAGVTLLIGYVYFCYTSCFHECAHQTLTGNGRFDIWFGKLIGTLALVPYTCYRECHIRHHAYLNTPRDWELWPYSDPNMSKPFRRGFAWMELLVGIFGPPITYGRIYWHKDSPLRDKAKAEVRKEYLVMLGFWGSVFVLCTLTDHWGSYFRAWFIPYCLAGFFQSIRKFVEHLGMSSYDPILGTRTVIGDNWYTRLCTYLNFDIFVHGAHHRHPKMGHDKLARETRSYIERNPETEFPVFRTYSAAIRHMVPSFLFTPGVGMNAGADPPGKTREAVVDFVTDVSKEVVAEEDVVVTG
ncbi:MAG: fatty acid desaturase [Planctomycetota bacterium]